MSLHVLLDELEIYQPFVDDIFKMREYRKELSVAAFMLTQSWDHRYGDRFLLLRPFLLYNSPSPEFCGFLLLPQLLFQISLRWLLLLVGVVVVLRGEDDLNVSIVASLATDLIGAGQSLASPCISLLLMLLRRHLSLHHLQINLLRQSTYSDNIHFSG